MDRDQKVVLTGFMGVGKTTVARHLSYITGLPRVDLDEAIEVEEKRSVADVIRADGEQKFRAIETSALTGLLESDARIVSLGGGAWTIAKNRDLVESNKFTSIWLESSFDHCWRNIRFSRNERPIAKNKEQARTLFEERQKTYALAEWHFVIRSGFSSYDVAVQIAEEVFQIGLQKR